MSPGKQAPEGQAAAVVAAGARLEAMRRRVRLSRLVVWAAIAAGPVALTVAVTSAPAVVEAAAPAKPATVRTRAAADPGGYAQLFVGAWLRSSAGDATRWQARLAQSMAPDVDLPDPASGAQLRPQSVTAVRTAQREAGRWSVTVAAQYAEAPVRYYVVPVAVDDDGGSFVVTGAPAVVAGPDRAQVPASPYAVSVPSGSDLAVGIGEFFAAYLTGAGEVGRYLAPGVRLSAVTPAPYTAVTVQQLLAVQDAAAAERVPADGTTVRVCAQVEARDAAGRWPLAYELTLKARSGRWEVAALETPAASGRGGGV
ncbi:conjugal transfer protein [Streptomyces sp. NPDC057062]|uniref:conjugal transfer protein n=1 Tax=Streptomyces sp. NPDC057062 TaxID=3346011 RepID=UPI003627B927